MNKIKKISLKTLIETIWLSIKVKSYLWITKLVNRLAWNSFKHFECHLEVKIFSIQLLKCFECKIEKEILRHWYH